MKKERIWAVVGSIVLLTTLVLLSLSELERMQDTAINVYYWYAAVSIFLGINYFYSAKHIRNVSVKTTMFFLPLLVGPLVLGIWGIAWAMCYVMGLTTSFGFAALIMALTFQSKKK